MKFTQFFNEVSLTTLAGSSLDKAAKEAIDFLKENKFYKVLFDFNGIHLVVTKTSTVESVIHDYYAESKNAGL